MGILVGFIVGILMLLWLLVIVSMFGCYARWSKYWSGIAQAYIPVNPLKWHRAGVWRIIRRRAREEALGTA
jgi:hypothetical protein